MIAICITKLADFAKSMYHSSVAYDQGKAKDPLKYFAAPENQDLGIVKTIRKPLAKLDLSPFPNTALTKVLSS